MISMKKRTRLALVIALVLLLSACTSLPRLLKDGGQYRNTKSGVFYIEAPLCYVAARRGNDAVALLEGTGAREELYPVGDFALCTATGELFVPADMILPTLEKFSADCLILCREDSLRIELARSTDAALLSAVTVALSEPKRISDDLLIPAPRYIVLLSSEENPDLFYRLEYRADEESDCGVLYDREQDIYVAAPAGLYELLTGGN